MTTALLETKAAFARRLGVNKSTITRAEQAGRLVMQGGKVDVEASLARWHATAGGRTDLAEKHARQRGQTIPQVSQPAPTQKTATTGAYSPDAGKVAALQPPQPLLVQLAPPATIGVDDDATRQQYRATVLHYENQTIKLQMALDKGQRHQLAAVQREAYSLGAALQAGLERLIDQTAPRLAAATDCDARAALLCDECGRLARSIRAEFVRSARRLRYGGLRQQGEKLHG